MRENRQDALAQLDTISESMHKVRALVEEDAYCMDILRQAYAVRQSLDALEQHLLEGHLQGCVPDGMKQGKGQEIIEELLQLYSMVGNRRTGQ